MRKIVISFLAPVLLGLLALMIYRSVGNNPSLLLSVLDIGQGDSIVVRTPDNITLVIDASSGHQEVDALAAVLPWNDRRIDYLLLTHPDLDHYGGAQWLLERYTIGQVLYNGDEINGSAGFKKLLAEIRKRQIPLRKVGAGETLRWSSGVRWQFLWPPAGYAAPSTNAGCVVSKVSWGREAVLLPCDLPSEQENELIKQQDVEAAILKAGHHGSKFSSSANFLQTVSPQWCLISAGRDNRYGHPNPAAVLRLRRTGCQLLSTIDSGTLTFRLSSTSIDYPNGSSRTFFGLPIPPFLAILNSLHN